MNHLDPIALLDLYFASCLANDKGTQQRVQNHAPDVVKAAGKIVKDREANGAIHHSTLYAIPSQEETTFCGI